jgi:hypothetical protein
VRLTGKVRKLLTPLHRKAIGSGGGRDQGLSAKPYGSGEPPACRSGSAKDVPHGCSFPFAPARRGNAATVQGGGDLAKGLGTGSLSLTDSWRNDGAVCVRLGLMGGVGDGAGLGEAWVAEGLSTGLGGG